MLTETYVIMECEIKQKEIEQAGTAELNKRAVSVPVLVNIDAQSACILKEEEEKNWLGFTPVVSALQYGRSLQANLEKRKCGQMFLHDTDFACSGYSQNWPCF